MRRAQLPDQVPGHFLRDDLPSLGLSRHDVAGLLGRDQLSLLGRGVYAVVDREPPTWVHDHVERARVAARAEDGAALLSHVSAGLLDGLPHPRRSPRRVKLTLLGPPRTSEPRSWMHLHRAPVPHRHRTVVDGVATTSLARTVIDCLRSLAPGDALAMADHAVGRRGLDLLEIEDTLDLMRRWPGVDLARQTLGLLDPHREGWLESWSAWSLFDQGLPTATWQVEVYDLEGRLVGRVDALWEEAGVVGEADGREKYLGVFDDHGMTPEAVATRMVRAGARESALRALGLGVCRWTTQEIVGQPEVVASRARAVSAMTDPRSVRCLIRRPGERWPTLYRPDRIRRL